MVHYASMNIHYNLGAYISRVTASAKLFAGISTIIFRFFEQITPTLCIDTQVV